MSAPPELPGVVRAALDVSRRLGFLSTTRHETGRLLATLAATRTGTLGELGTGCGVGAAWLASGAPDDVRIVTVEVDPRLAEGAREVFAGDTRVEVRTGDWTTLEQFAPFSLLFVDVREVKSGGLDRIADLVGCGRPGGAGRLHPQHRLAAGVRRPGGLDARAVADRRAFHRRRRDGHRRRVVVLAARR